MRETTAPTADFPDDSPSCGYRYERAPILAEGVPTAPRAWRGSWPTMANAGKTEPTFASVSKRGVGRVSLAL
jgi:hypothetical protein